MPDDIIPPSIKTGSRQMAGRLEKLVKQVTESDHKTKEMADLCKTIEKKLGTLKKTEEALLKAEKEIFRLIAESMNEQSKAVIKP